MGFRIEFRSGWRSAIPVGFRCPNAKNRHPRQKKLGGYLSPFGSIQASKESIAKGTSDRVNPNEDQ